MMTSQILKSGEVTKTQKSRYLENETLFFLRIKKIHLLHTKGYFMAKSSFAAELTFNKSFQFQKFALNFPRCWTGGIICSYVDNDVFLGFFAKD